MNHSSIHCCRSSSCSILKVQRLQTKMIWLAFGKRVVQSELSSKNLGYFDQVCNVTAVYMGKREVDPFVLTISIYISKKCHNRRKTLNIARRLLNIKIDISLNGRNNNTIPWCVHQWMYGTTEVTCQKWCKRHINTNQTREGDFSVEKRDLVSVMFVTGRTATWMKVDQTASQMMTEKNVSDLHTEAKFICISFSIVFNLFDLY